MALGQCLLADPDTKHPGWKARFTNGTLLKCAHTGIPMTSKISTGQELTRIREELASCWPQSATGMRSSAAAPCFISPHPIQLPLEFPHRHIFISEPFLTLPDLVKYISNTQKSIRDKKGKKTSIFNLETRLKPVFSPSVVSLVSSVSHRYSLWLQKWLLV